MKNDKPPFDCDCCTQLELDLPNTGVKKMIVGNWETREVQIDGKILSPEESQKIRNHSPDGFAWGYGGSGPAQLALAILLHYTSAMFAMEHYQNFKWDVIASLPQSDFSLDEADVHTWIFDARAADRT